MSLSFSLQIFHDLSNSSYLRVAAFLVGRSWSCLMPRRKKMKCRSLLSPQIPRLISTHVLQTTRKSPRHHDSTHLTPIFFHFPFATARSFKSSRMPANSRTPSFTLHERLQFFASYMLSHHLPSISPSTCLLDLACVSEPIEEKSKHKQHQP